MAPCPRPFYAARGHLIDRTDGTLARSAALWLEYLPMAKPSKQAEQKRLAQIARDFERAQRKRDQTIRQAVQRGVLSQREIARAVGLSHTRIQQLARD